jgi:signal peptide peptidase SppA
MKNYRNVANHVFNQPWMITPEMMGMIVQVLQYRMAGGQYTQEEINARTGDNDPHPEPYMVQGPELAGAGGEAAQAMVAVLPLYGVIAQRMNMIMEMSGGTSTERFSRAFQQMADDSQISAIVLDVDSPGGSVFGVDELSAQIFKARAKKPIVAVANSSMHSAAYYIGSAASEVWITPGGMLGSIGAIAVHWDESKAIEMEGLKPTIITYGKHKAEGNSLEPIDDEALAEAQKMVDDYGMMFDKAVARNRGVTAATVRRDFGQGRIFRAQDAVSLGMADRAGTLQEAIASLLAKPGRGGIRAEDHSHSSSMAACDEEVDALTPRPPLPRGEGELGRGGCPALTSEGGPGID